MHLIKKLKWNKSSVITNKKGLQLFYIHGRNLMTGSVFNYQRLSKDLFFINLSKFGHQFSCTQK